MTETPGKFTKGDTRARERFSNLTKAWKEPERGLGLDESDDKARARSIDLMRMMRELEEGPAT
jgi:hypothetical protein